MSASALEDWVEGWWDERRAANPFRIVLRPGPQDLVIELSTRESTGEQVEAEHAEDEDREDECIVELRAVGRARADVDATLLEATARTVSRCRDVVVARRGWGGEELNVTDTRALTSEVRRAAATEVQAVLGFTTAEARSLVGMAMGPADVLAAVTEALRRGETSWAQVRRFWDAASSSARGLSEDQQLLVALSLFGTDPALAAPERLDEHGDLPGGDPWPHARFETALAREVTACEGSDVAAERAKRARAYRDRAARVRVHDDGTATLVITGPAVPVVGAWARFDHVSRTLRSQGAPDTLAQLAVDSMLAVLGHGHLEVPEPGPLGDLAPEQLDDLVAVVNGASRIAMQVVVPADALGVGHPVCATCAAALGHDAPDGIDDAADSAALSQVLPFDQEIDPPSWIDTEQTTTPAGDRPDTRAAGSVQPDRAPPDTAPPDTAPPATAPPGTAPPGTAPPDNAPPGTAPPDNAPPDNAPPSDTQPSGHNTVPSPLTPSPQPPPRGRDPGLRHGRGKVGEVLGAHPFFISPGHARELFYTPGTTLHRILVDPADGRCLERTITTYRPDTDMRRQVHAADVYSRAPWTRLTGRTLEIDHVIPYGTDPGGTTTEGNLADLDKRTHQTKTLRLLALTMNERRDLTFTTLLGHVTRTRAHDYRQYLLTAHPDDVGDRRDLASQALYAALADRPEHRRRPAPDSWLTLDHTDADGQRHPGPPERPDTLSSLLNLPDKDALPDEDI